MLIRPLGLLLLSLATVQAQSSVWKVTRGTGTLYLGGTIHMLRPSDFPLPAEFDTAFAASAKLYFETDLARIRSPEMQAVIMQRGMFTDGTTLDKVLTPEAWKAAQQYCEQAGLPLEMMRPMKPWLFALTMATIELLKLGISTEGVDLHYFNAATAAGKPVGELEPFEQHIAHLVNLGAGKESEMIAKSLDDLRELPRVLNEIIAAWRAGNIAQIDALMLRDIRKKYPAIFKSLLADRNTAWLGTLDNLLKTPEVEFVLVGAGHLAGPEGLLALLKTRGCKVEQVIAKGTHQPAKKK